MKTSLHREIAEFFLENDGFLIVTHEKPDGDALGSLFGLWTVLRENGKKADAFLQNEPPLKYKPFQPEGIIIGIPPPLNSYRWIVCLDSSNHERLGIEKSAREKILSLPLANIDHHPDNTSFGIRNFVDPRAAAVAEIIFRSLRKKMRISQAAAEFLLIGIVADTGGFRFDNTSPDVLKAAAEIISCGADYRKIMNRIFFEKPLSLVKLEAELIVKHLKTAFNGRYAWAYMSDEFLKEMGVEKKDTEAVIESIRQIKGVEIAALIYGKNDGFHFSLRSKNGKYSVAKIARALNGGGHELAAGGLIKAEKFETAENTLLKLIGETLNP